MWAKYEREKLAILLYFNLLRYRFENKYEYKRTELTFLKITTFPA